MTSRVRRLAATATVAMGVAMPLGVVGPVAAAHAADTCTAVGNIGVCVFNDRAPGTRLLGVGLKQGTKQYNLELACNPTGVYLLSQTGPASTSKIIGLGKLLESLCSLNA